MSGRRDSNLRSGDITENLGISLLQKISAVAFIPRQEDIGIDAICTILEKDKLSPRQLNAKETFAVQLKSDSIKNIYYSKKELSWLLKLEIPFFFGVVNYTDVSISIYSTNNAIRFLHLTSEEQCENGISFEMVETDKHMNHDKVFLGSPILSWTIKDEEIKISEVINLMRTWCEIENQNKKLRSLDSGRFFIWKPNTKPDFAGEFYSSVKCREAIIELKRPVETLALAGLGSNNPNEQWKFWRPLLEFLVLNNQLMGSNLEYWDSLAEKYINREKGNRPRPPGSGDQEDVQEKSDT